MDQRDVADLEAGLQEIWDTAAQLGLDPYPVHFEVVLNSAQGTVGGYLSATQAREVAAVPLAGADVIDGAQ